MIGQTISHYKILEKLGEGGMGVVYKAEDITLKRIVALKFLPPHLAASEQDKARFMNEAQAAASLNHPNICTIYGIDKHEGQMFIAMEFVDGQTLRQKRDAVSFKQAIEIGIQIADGLAAAHEKGIVHRDIKPENIMIRKDGIAQIMDFGLAKLRASGSKITRLTKEGSTVGTAGYMSPEQVQGQDSDHRSDIFSLGVLLYELLTGQLPFKGVHETALAYEIVNVDAAPMSSVKPELDPNLDSIVLECLEKDPRERTQSAAQISLDLKRYRRESSKQKMSRITAARPIQQTSPSQNDVAAALAQPSSGTHQVTSGRRNMIPWGVATLCILLLSGLALIHFRETLPELQSINASITPPTGTSFNNSIGGHMALSSDGSMLALVAADSAGNTSLWVRPLNSSSARQLSETDGAQFPFWSPDNKFIGFFAAGKLKKISASGGPTVVICDAPNGRGGTWNQDGVIVFAPTFDFTGLFKVSAAGGAPSPATHLDTTRNESNHRWPHFLPDGKHFIYTTQGANRTSEYSGSMFVSSLDGSIDKLLIKVSSNMAYSGGYLLYVRQKSVLAQPFDLSKLELFGDPIPVVGKVEFSGDKSRGVFSVSNNGILTYQVPGNNAGMLSLCDRTGKKLGDVGGGRSMVNGARFSPDGTKIAFDSPDPESNFSDIWLYDIARMINTRITFDPAAEWNPIWSPDGKKVAYSTDRQGSGIYIKNSDGTESEQELLKSRATNAPLDWSPDGRLMIYLTINESTGVDLTTVPLEGKHEQTPFANTKFSENNARISPDGHWVVYDSDESGKSEIYTRPFPSGGGKWQISSSGGNSPMWSPDGLEVYYNQSAGVLMAVAVKAVGSVFTAGTPTRLFEIPRCTILDVSKDGKQFLVAAITGLEANQPITLVTNWDKELKKK
jgi:serine/threonine protein kinase